MEMPGTLAYTGTVDSRSELQLEALIRALPQIVVYLDNSGTVIRHNANLCEILTPGVEDISGEAVIDYLHPWSESDARELARLLAFPLREDEDVRVEYAVSLKTSWSSRGIFRAELRRSPAWDDGQTPSYLLILEDVTSLRQMEEEYRRVQRIQGLLPLIRGFGADYKERLTVMYGNVDFALELIKDDSRPESERLREIRDSLSSIIKNLERSNGRLDNILWMTDGGRRNIGEFSLSDAVREVGEQSILGSNKSLDIIMGNPLPPFHGDYEKILQMLQNIMINAVQAGNEAYQVSVSVESVTRADGEYAMISIADHGDGMSLDLMARAEQPFFTTKDQADGLGLFIAKNIALEHGGSIEIQSTSGKGTTVHMYLPFHRHQQKSRVQRQIPDGLKILILDDNPDIQDIWERLLYQLGIQGSFVTSPSHAYDSFERASQSDYPFHMVILEDSQHHIPGVFQLLRRMKKLAPDLIAIYTSSHSPSFTVDELVAKGFSAYLRKPFRLIDFQNALIKALYKGGGGD